MKEYPSIPGSSKAPRKPCIAFLKYDGSNLRFEWSPKRGWHKFGTRHRMFDQTDPVFGPAVELFHKTLAPTLTDIIKSDKTWRAAQSVTAYTEYLGPKSFAGIHDLEPDNTPMELVLFDVNVHKKGFVSPREFVNTFGALPFAAKVLYEGNLTDQFIEDVRAGKYNSPSELEEGVVCKGGSGHDLWMTKIKTRAYLEKLQSVFRDGWEQYAE